MDANMKVQGLDPMQGIPELQNSTSEGFLQYGQ